MAGLPNGPGGLEESFGEWGVTGAGISSLSQRTEAVVRAQLLQRVQGQQGMNDATTVIQDTLSDLFGGIGDALQLAGDVINGIVNAVLGVFGINWLAGDAQSALEAQAAAIASLASAITALQASQQGYHQSGTSRFLDFSLKQNAYSLGVEWLQIYSEGGSSLLGVIDGRGGWHMQTDAPRTCIAIYTAATSETDYQLVGASFASSPYWFNAIAQSRNFLIGRSNAAGTSYVYADLGRYDAEIGCVVNGTKTTWVRNESFTFKPSGIYYLVCGTTGGQRIFQLLDGTKAVLTYTEPVTAQSSRVGADYRYAGMGGRLYATGLGGGAPARVGAFAFADNAPPNFVGSGALMTRVATGAVGVAGGSAVLGNNFWDTRSDHTDDITIDLTTGKFTVSLEGWYRVEVRSLIAGSAFPNMFQWVIWKNGAANRQIGGSHMRGRAGVPAGDLVPDGVDANGLIYLIPGDYVQMGYETTGGTSGVLAGEASGFKTYFSISLLSRSHA